MVNGEMFSYISYIQKVIPRIRFIIAGNIPNQLPPVKEEYRKPFENPTELTKTELAIADIINKEPKDLDDISSHLLMRGLTLPKDLLSSFTLSVTPRAFVTATLNTSSLLNDRESEA